MANKELESTVLSIEVETSVDKEGNPKFTKKKLGNLVPGADPNKVMAVADKIAYFADKEGLDAHGRSAQIRFQEKEDK